MAHFKTHGALLHNHFYKTLESVTTHEDQDEGYKNSYQGLALSFPNVFHLLVNIAHYSKDKAITNKTKT